MAAVEGRADDGPTVVEGPPSAADRPPVVDTVAMTARPPSPRPSADLLDALFAVSRRWPRVWHAADVPEAAASVVRCFRGGPGTLSVGEIAAVLAVAPSTASRLVDAAARAGVVGKRREPAGSRFVSVSLTPDGEALLARLVLAEQRWLGAATPGWGARDRWQARRFMLDLASGLEGTDIPTDG